MGHGDLAHDRQAQAGAAGPPRARGVQALEAAETRSRSAGGTPGPRSRTRRRHARQLQGHRAGGGQGAQALGGGRGHVADVGRPSAHGESALVGAREREQRVDDRREPLDLLDRAAQHRGGLRVEVVGAQAHLELGPHRGRRRAQLVRRVGDEAVLLLHARLDARQHGVQRDGGLRDLVAGRRLGQAVREAVGADAAGLGAEALDRAQGAAGQPPAARGGGEDRRRRAASSRSTSSRCRERSRRSGGGQAPRGSLAACRTRTQAAILGACGPG
jgi:hypothetical protein